MKTLKKIFKIIGVLILLAIIFISVFYFDELNRYFFRGETYTFQEATSCGDSNTSNVTRDVSYLDEISKATKQIQQLKDYYRIPGLSVSVSVNNKIIWEEAFGCKDIANNKPILTDTKLRVGSISKSMTAIGLMALVEAGKIDLNKSIYDYLPNFPKKEYDIKVLDLATHQSGIRHYKGVEFLSNIQYNSIEESVEVFKNDPLLFEPGTDYKYSSYNYVLLSHLIEKVSGTSFIDYMSQNVFQPLQMRSTNSTSQDFIGYSSTPNKNKISKTMEVNLSNKLAGGGFLSTSKDLVLMLQNLDTLLSKDAQNQLFTNNHLKTGEETEYGIGFRKTYSQSTNKNIIHHGGTSAGGRAFLLKVVEGNIIVAICTNNDNGVLAPDNYGLQEVFDIAKSFIRN